MDVPGLNDEQSNGTEIAPQRIQLPPGNEWRIELEVGNEVKIKLLSGTCEIFGAELPIGAEYIFKGAKHAALYTWHGCEIEYTGIISEYTSDETPMSVYANLHFALESQREQNNPPNVLILGPRNSGKTSLCKILSSYANKGGESYPMYVNIDPSEGVFSPPGGLSAAPISDILDVEEGWGLSPVHGPALLHPKNPLVFFYGLDSPRKNSKYYKHVLQRLSVGVHARMAEDQKVRRSGIIVDTPWSIYDKDSSLNLVASAVADFKINIIVVVGHERLYSDVLKKFKNKTVLKVPKSGGCVDRDDATMRQLHKQQIHDYFYGTHRQPFAPYTYTLDYNAVHVYRVADAEDESLLPGSEEGAVRQELIKLDASSILQNCVMAALNAQPDDSPDLIKQAEVVGFVHIVEANDDRHKLKVLIPVTGRAPNRPFVIGDYRYHE